MKPHLVVTFEFRVRRNERTPGRGAYLIMRWAERWMRRHGFERDARDPLMEWRDDIGDDFIMNYGRLRLTIWAV